MTITLIRFSAAAAALFSSVSAATPPLIPREGGFPVFNVPLLKRAPRILAADDNGEWAAELGRKLISKYNPDVQTFSKRGQGHNLLTNQVR